MTSKTLILQLIHGRADPAADMQGWGFDAEPIEGVAFLHGTYMTTLTVGFANQETFNLAQHRTGWKPLDDLILEMPLHGDLIRCGDAYFGDFELYVSP